MATGEWGITIELKGRRAATVQRAKRVTLNELLNEGIMIVKITYATKEKTWHTKHTYSNVQKTIDVAAEIITRSPIGRGAAQNRYRYDAIFKAPDDAEFVNNDGTLTCWIDRNLNHDFKPKKLKFDGKICFV